MSAGLIVWHFGIWLGWSSRPHLGHSSNRVWFRFVSARRSWARRTDAQYARLIRAVSALNASNRAFSFSSVVVSISRWSTWVWSTSRHDGTAIDGRDGECGTYDLQSADQTDTQHETLETPCIGLAHPMGCRVTVARSCVQTVHTINGD